jgi:tripartite-type tricarboxylate transporter receptor subunit TctC
MARIIKRAVEENDLLAQPLVIINRGGAGGTIGSRSVKDAAPDGYTVLLLHDAILTAKFAGNAEYGAEAFLSVAATGTSNTVIAVHDESPIRDLNELLNRIEQKPGSVTFAANLGAPSHFAALLLEQTCEGGRFRFTQSGGGTRRFEHLRGGHVDATSFSIDEYVRFRSDGVRALAYLGAQRHPKLSDVPTAKEQGVDIVHGITQYWWMPKGTPSERADLFASALSRAMQSDYVRGKLAEMNVEPVFLTDGALEHHLAESTNAMSAVDPRATLSLPNLPAWTAAAAALFGAALVVSKLRAKVSVTQKLRESETPAQWLIVAASLALTVVYAASVIKGWLGLGLGTSVFVVAMGCLLARNNRRLMVTAFVVAAIAGITFHGVFTKLFVIDL